MGGPAPVAPAGPDPLPRSAFLPLTTLALVGIGAAALVLRTRLLVLPPTDRVMALCAIFGAILVASLAVPLAPGARRLHPAIVLAAGLAAVGGAALAAGRPVPVPFGAWAIPLSVLAAVAEEALFRRATYGALEALGPALAIGAAALVFALIHVPLYGVAAFPVDLGAGLLFGWQRWAGGTWTVPAGTHAAANLLAVIVR